MAQQIDKPVKSVDTVDDVTVITYEDGTVEKHFGPVDLKLGNVSGGLTFNFGNS